MTVAEKYKTLTGSGKGLRIDDKKITDFSTDEVRDLLKKYSFVVFSGKPATIEEVDAHLETFGPLTQNEHRKGDNGTLLKIDGSKADEGEVLLGNGFLPLHRDGALMGNDIEMVGIYCQEYTNVVNGRTFVVDSAGAQEDIPKEYMDLLREKGIEGKSVDEYYAASQEKWLPVAGFIECEGKEYLNVGFPSPEGEDPSWLIQIPGETEEKFREVFNAMTDIVMDTKHCYYHDWKEGDLVLFDNRKTLHGREAFTGGPRALANIQVLVA